MKRVGAYMTILGLASLILPYLGYQLRFLNALDDMGINGIIIKVVIIAVGAFLFLRKTEKPKAESVEDAELRD